MLGFDPALAGTVIDSPSVDALTEPAAATECERTGWTLEMIPTVAPACAQGGKSGVERLYILNCGEGVAGDISRWSPGVNVGKSMDFVDSCYLIKHGQGWLLWDTGLAEEWTPA